MYSIFLLVFYAEIVEIREEIKGNEFAIIDEISDDNKRVRWDRKRVA